MAQLPPLIAVGNAFKFLVIVAAFNFSQNNWSNWGACDVGVVYLFVSYSVQEFF